jgi:hypothetical protein
VEEIEIRLMELTKDSPHVGLLSLVGELTMLNVSSQGITFVCNGVVHLKPEEGKYIITSAHTKEVQP